MSNSRWRASARRNSVPPVRSLARLVIKPPQHGVLETVPKLVAGAHRIGEGVKGEQDQVLHGLNLAGEIADDRRVVQVAALGDLRHGQMVLDDQAQGVGLGAVQSQPAGDAQGDLAADFLVVPGAKGLARSRAGAAPGKERKAFSTLREISA